MRELETIRAFLYSRMVSKGLEEYLYSRCLTGEFEKYFDGLDILTINYIK